MKISAIQTDVSLGDPDANLRKLHQHVVTEVAQGSRLVVFPECFVSGYCFASREEASRNSQAVDGQFTQSVVKLCGEHHCYVVFGMVERGEHDMFNVSVLAGPHGIVGIYRKIHLPWLGVDRFTTHGDRPFQIFEIEEIRIGMLICYDAGFPEATRHLALAGADIVILPTNWPPGAEQMAKYAINTRALENSIYFLAVNRVGIERGFRFIGCSRICDPTGKTLAAADHENECVLRASIDTAQARRKRYTRVAGEHVIDRFADRRPEMYGRLCEPHTLPRPGRNEDPLIN